MPQRGKQLGNHLGRLAFPPMKSEHAFGFVDPTDVLREAMLFQLLPEGLDIQTGKGFQMCKQFSILERLLRVPVRQVRACVAGSLIQFLRFV